MKNILFAISTVLMLYSCNSSQNEVQTMNPNDIRLNEVVQESLTSEQMQKITRIHSTFAEVDPLSLEETINNFKRDLNPDNEIDIWLQMANAYEKYLSSRKETLNTETKKEIYKLILCRSMMSDEEAIVNSKLTILTEKEAKEILKYYTLAPDPLEVIEKP